MRAYGLRLDEDARFGTRATDVCATSFRFAVDAERRTASIDAKGGLERERRRRAVEAHQSL